MKSSISCLLVALYASGACGFTRSRALVGRLSSSPIKHDSPVLRSHRKYGPKLLNHDESMSPIQRDECPCCLDSKYGMSPRAARIELPLRTLFASAALASPALADDEDTEALLGVVEVIKDTDTTSTLSVEASIVEVKEANTTPTPPTEPPKLKTFGDALQKYFPKALPTSVVATTVQNALSGRRFTRANTLFGTCVCPDEINNKPGKSLPSALQLALTDNNGVNHLGGLAGLPYMGASGMKAFLSHAPLNGKVLIMYGPHVGVTNEGYVGRVERLGQESPTLDCDTTLNALKKALAQRKKERTEGTVIIEGMNAAETEKIGSPDKREEYMVAKLRLSLDSNDAAGLKKEDLAAFATYQMFDLIKEQVLKQLEVCLKEETWDGSIDEIVLLGGIIINRGQEVGSIDLREDYFQPLVFDSYSNLGTFGALTGAKDLFQPTFGARPIQFYA